LEAHVKAAGHDNIKDNKCKNCDGSIAEASLKSTCKTVHDNIKDNKCTKCDYAALQQHHLEAHVKIAVHDDQPV
jgi:hypothetical protein